MLTDCSNVALPIRITRETILYLSLLSKVAFQCPEILLDGISKLLTAPLCLDPVLCPVRPVDAKVRAVEHYSALTTKKELMLFLALVGYYCSFCRNFSTMVAPLTKVLKGRAKFVWSLHCYFSKKFNSYQLNYSTTEK